MLALMYPNLYARYWGRRKSGKLDERVNNGSGYQNQEIPSLISNKPGAFSIIIVGNIKNHKI